MCFWVEIDGNNTNILKVLDGRPASPASMGIFIGMDGPSKYGGNIWHLFGEPEGRACRAAKCAENEKGDIRMVS